MDSAPTHRRHGVVAFTLSLVAVAYLDRVCISTAAPAIKSDLGLSGEQLGFAFSAFTLAYALFEVPSGWMADRFGARVTIARIVVWWSLMTAATGLATGFASLLTLRFLFGLGEAGTFPATTRVYGRWLSEAERGRTFGMAIMAGALSGAVTQPLVALLLGVMSWRHTFPIFGAVGIVWTAAWWWWFRDDPHDHAGVNAAELRLIEAGGGRAHAHAPVPWRQLFGNRTLAALCVMYTGVIYGWYFYLTWLPTYLLEARGFDLRAAGFRAALPLTGIALGVFAGGFASDHLVQRFGLRAGRRIPALIGLPLAAIAIAGAVATPDPVAAAWFLAAAAGLAALGVPAAWAVCLEIGGPHAGVVSGAMNMFGNLGGALVGVTFGYAVGRWHNWTAPLLSIAACYLTAAACWLAIDPARRIGGTPAARQ